MTEYTEFTVENGGHIDRELLLCGRVPDGPFEAMYNHSAMVTADVLIRQDGNYLLFERNEEPLQGEFWLAGGSVPKGIPLLEAVRTKARSETGLTIDDLTLLQHNRAFLAQDHFGNGKGTDTISPVFLAEATGDVSVDTNHKTVHTIPCKSYTTSSVRNDLHPFVRDIIDVAEGLRRPGGISEYAVERGELVDLARLTSGFVDDDTYSSIHKHSCLFTSDALVYHEPSQGFVLLRRDGVPIDKEWLFTGGRVARGVPLLDSIGERVKGECRLEISDLKLLHVSRELYGTDPFGHGKGTDTFGYKFVATGHGDIQHDGRHDGMRIVKPDEYPTLRSEFIPLLQHTLDIAVAMTRVADAQGISFPEFLKRNATDVPLITA